MKQLSQMTIKLSRPAKETGAEDSEKEIDANATVRVDLRTSTSHLDPLSPTQLPVECGE